MDHEDTGAFPGQTPPSAHRDISADPVFTGPVKRDSSGDETDFTQVTAERFEDAPEGQPAGSIHIQSLRLDLPKPPVLSTWLCLIVAWLFLGSAIPFTVFIGIPFNLVALILGAVCLSRGGILTGLLVFLLGTLGSLAVYFVGFFKFLSGL